MVEEKLNMNDVKSRLEVAGLYDVSLREDDLISYYKALKSSESTANRESRIRDSTLTDDDVDISSSDPVNVEPNEKRSAFTPKHWSINKRFESLTTNKMAKRLKLDDLNEKLSSIDVYESLPTKHESLKIIHHKQKSMGPFYCQKSLNKLPIKERVKLISNYHLALNMEVGKYQRNSIHFAEWGNPVHSSTRFNGDLYKKTDMEPDSKQDLGESDSDNSPAPIVTTRSGRQVVKRKFFTESEPDLVVYSDDEENKIKKLKPDTPKLIKQKCETITSLSSPKSRTENILTLIKKDEQKKIEAEKAQDKFLDTLTELSDDDYELKITSTQPSREGNNISKEDDKGFRKIVVIPPIPHARKAYRRVQSLQPVKEALSSSASTSTVNGSADIPKKILTPRSAKKTPQTKCPICNQIFYSSEIEEHASTCGLTNELEIENNLPNLTAASRITCEICDKVFLLDNEYEVHVQQCIAAKK